MQLSTAIVLLLAAAFSPTVSAGRAQSSREPQPLLVRPGAAESRVQESGNWAKEEKEKARARRKERYHNRKKKPTTMTSCPLFSESSGHSATEADSVSEWSGDSSDGQDQEETSAASELAEDDLAEDAEDELAGDEVGSTAEASRAGLSKKALSKQ